MCRTVSPQSLLVRPSPVYLPSHNLNSLHFDVYRQTLEVQTICATYCPSTTTLQNFPSTKVHYFRDGGGCSLVPKYRQASALSLRSPLWTVSLSFVVSFLLEDGQSRFLHMAWWLLPIRNMSTDCFLLLKQRAMLSRALVLIIDPECLNGFGYISKVPVGSVFVIWKRLRFMKLSIETRMSGTKFVLLNMKPKHATVKGTSLSDSLNASLLVCFLFPEVNDFREMLIQPCTSADAGEKYSEKNRPPTLTHSCTFLRVQQVTKSKRSSAVSGFSNKYAVARVFMRLFVVVPCVLPLSRKSRPNWDAGRISPVEGRTMRQLRLLKKKRIKQPECKRKNTKILLCPRGYLVSQITQLRPILTKLYHHFRSNLDQFSCVLF